VYFSGERYETPDDFDSWGVGTEDDLSVLRTSKNFLMVYPDRVVSSCLVEAGYAIVAGKPSSYFARSDEDLPYMLRGLIEGDPKVRLFLYRDGEDLVSKIDRYADHIIGVG
jgi:hypothetical protein